MRRTANLGLKANLNLLVAYDPLWPSAFEDERVRLANALGTSRPPLATAWLRFLKYCNT